MRKICINEDWKFYKNCPSIDKIGGECETVNIPHTWNNLDGQDGGCDYYRGATTYIKTLNIEKLEDKDYYIEFEAVNSICDVYVNGKKLMHHEGGFALFRGNATNLLVNGKNEIIVIADNSPNDYIYPQMADFTFYGGIYRDCYLIEVSKSRFDLDYYGGEGVMVTPTINGSVADVEIRSFITNCKPGLKERVVITFCDELIASELVDAGEVVHFSIHSPKLWDGLNDPNMYTAQVMLVENNKEIDRRDIDFGIRSFSVDKDGFILNNRRYPLRGVSRHQDRLDMGWAITKSEHDEDMQLIKEVGANSIRLAHYQHNKYFYDLCDRNGMVVWAEIPFISEYLPKGNDNVKLQMTELIVQNYNHPSIMFWGLSNEITITGEHDELVGVHKELNELVKSLDKTRLTTMANVTMLDTSSELLNISDVMAYNHYFGWYVGSVEGNAEWLDDFRKQYPNKPIGLSEYGCEAILTWHTSNPTQGDYTEEYQSYYHEKMLEIFDTHPYLWCTYVWNMFDFGVDQRNEGGVQGRNNKGLVTYDRKTKKDSFYIYKAHWSTEPFVHIASKRYVYRAEKVTKVKVYSNQPEITLIVNGNPLETKKGKYVFEFDVPLRAFFKNEIIAVSGSLKDVLVVHRVRKPKEEYILKQEESTVSNWFDKDGNKIEFSYPEGKLSIKDKLSTIMANPEGEQLVFSMVEMAKQELAKKGQELPIKITKQTFKLFGNMTIERLAGMAGDKLPIEVLKQVNDELNKIDR